MTNVKRFVVGGGADLEPCLGRVLFVFPLQRTGNFPSNIFKLASQKKKHESYGWWGMHSVKNCIHALTKL